MGDALVIDGASKRFGATQALDGSELRLVAGEWLGLLGPNGAGKTTLVRATCGRVRLDQGTIRLLGVELRDGDDRPSVAARRRMGIVPQEIALYPMLTAQENLTVFGELHGLRGAALRRRVEWALDWTGLEQRAAEPVKRYSGGMKRRLNLACGVLHEPEVILLDEPTAGVDPQSRQRIWEMLAGLQRAGASLLLTTHQLDEAERVCDRIAIIDHGRTIAAGTLGDLIERTVGRERRVSLYLAEPPAGGALEAPFEVDGRTVRVPVIDVAAELPARLEEVHRAGCIVEDVRLDAPSLHAVFLSLTGRELRE